MILRPYQEEAIAAVVKATAAGKRRLIVNLPTGTGKTILAMHLVARTLAKGNRALWLAHRDELLVQARETFEIVTPASRPDLKVGLMKADADETDADLVFASVQTATREQRLQGLLASASRAGKPFRVVVYDEVHHAAAEGSKRILGALPPETIVLGLSATVERSDGVSLEAQFPDGIVYQLPLLVAVRKGYLVDFVHKRVMLAKLDLDQVKMHEGDFAVGQLGNMLIDAEVGTATGKALEALGRGRKALVFTATVAQAEVTRTAIESCGISAKVVSGDTPEALRREALDAFRNGWLRAIVNCAVLTEGYDEPSADCIVIARPTMSKTLYLQMLGRGLRTFPGKRDCLVIDLVGAGTRHTPIQAPVLIGLPDDYTSDLGCAEEKTRRELTSPLISPAFKKLLEEEAVPESWANWIETKVQGELCYAATGGNRMLVVVMPVRAAEDTWIVMAWTEKGRLNATPKAVWRDLALGIGEDILRRANARILSDREATWRKKPPSSKQIEAASRWHVPVKNGETAGELSDRMTAVIAKAKVGTYLDGKDKSMMLYAATEQELEAVLTQVN